METTTATLPASTICTAPPVLTLVNVFAVAPEQQERLVALLQRATDEVIRQQPGFISDNFHRSLDGTRVVNYAQWESREAFEAMLRQPEFQAHVAECLAISAHQPTVCEVVSVHHTGS